MNSIAKKLVRNSTILRNTISLSYYNTTSSSANFTRENIASYKLAGNDENYNLQNAPLMSGFYLQSYFNYIERKSSTMDLNDALNCFNKLSRAVRKDKWKHVEFTDFNGFKELCNIVLKNARYLEMDEVIQLIYIFRELNIPYSSVLFQTLLQLVKANVNILNIGQIIRLHRIFNNIQDSSTMMDSILITLKHLFNQRVGQELHGDSKQLVPALAFSNKIRNRDVKNQILDMLSENTSKINMLNIRDIFSSLEAEDWKSTKKIMNIISHFIRKNLESMKEKDIIHIVSLISNEQTDALNAEINMLLEHMVDIKCSLNGKLEILKYLNALRYSCTSLLDSISNEILEDLSVLKWQDANIISDLIRSFVISSHKPNDWETLAQALEVSLTKSPNWTLPKLIDSVVHLLSLDHYSPAMLEMIFQQCNSSLYFTPASVVINRACKLHWCVKQLHPEYEGTMLKEDILQKTMKHQTVITITKRPFKYLEESIKAIAGGEKYVLSKVKSRIIRTVDFVVVKKPDGSFVDLSGENVNVVEDLLSMSDCNKILFYAFPKVAYCSNIPQLFSALTMEMKVMASYPRFHIIIINPFTWTGFSVEAKIESIQDAIREKCQEA